ncbi:MAG: hypothetical protein KJ000_13100, partial [Pirellulaceae bacterium]|nr:hypothetical protein [Pirellulaceae bacterium]
METGGTRIAHDVAFRAGGRFRDGAELGLWEIEIAHGILNPLTEARRAQREIYSSRLLSSSPCPPCLCESPFSQYSVDGARDALLHQLLAEVE